MDKVERLFLYLPVGVSALLYVLLGYFLERHQTLPLVLSYALLFGAFLWLVYKAVPCSVNYFIVVAIGFRLLLLLPLPTLSDDIYRFIWDGRLLSHGIDPFAQLPSYYIENGIRLHGIDAELYAHLNSPNYFTIYPPFAQLVFWLAAELSPDSILGSAIVIRLFIILAEIGTIYLLLKLTKLFGMPAKNVLWYALNPLVILELTGNLHFEAFMLFFIVASVYLLCKAKHVWAALFYSLAIASKLIPLIFLPLFLRRLKWPRLWKLYLMTGLFTGLAFLPLLSSELVDGMGSSIALYFQKFEFNASIYYLVREVGFEVKGYNIIETAGKWLALSTVVAILVYSFFEKIKPNQLMKSIMWVMTIYLLLATIVHPWYLTTIVLASVFTHYRFAIVWSALVFLTYVGYSPAGYVENLWLTAVEYGVVIVYMFYEIVTRYKSQKLAVEA